MSTRGSALWGRRTGGNPRRRALSGIGPRVLVAAVLAASLGLAVPGVASSGGGSTAVVPQSLLDSAQANPGGSFSVVIQGDGSEKSERLAGRLAKELGKDQSGVKGGSTKPFKAQAAFTSIDGVAATVSGRDILSLRKKTGVLSVVPDSPVTVAANPQKWPSSVAADWFLSSAYAYGSRAATIAIIDSGVDKAAAGLGTRLLKQVDLGGGSSSGDSRGHGTFVAGVAAGNGFYRGVAPDARLVSLDVFDGQGQGTTSDVIRAADWILKNKDVYGIRVANFSLQTSQPSSFLYDPLDAAVERLWQAGVVVVASAGNYGTAGAPSGVLFAPGNDPFVITVGAVDINGSSATWDDTSAPWSAYGYTPDGFAKPEVTAPGRYMTEQIPLGASLLGAFPANVLDPLSGLIQMSGTSFSAAVVSGVVANLLGVHPEWTPDQVKGALMLSAAALPAAAPGSVGVGEVNLYRALKGQTAVTTPPNPNAALEQFLVTDPAGGALPVFDAQGWINSASTDPSWNTASWSSASWSSASWSSASWSSASWTSASWSSASWSSASWSSASWSSASWTNGAESEGTGDG
jgi:serine protease AprX